MEDFWAVVPAGGAGTRLWPLSRTATPKFLLDLIGDGRSLVQHTRDRLAPLAGDRLLVVTGEVHRDRVAEQLPGLPGDQLLGEPAPRDSMAAIGWAAAWLERRHPDAVMGSFAADHAIGDDAGFAEAVRTAVDGAREGWLVTLGIRPTEPATGFGYVRVGDPVPGHPGLRHARAFVEKPDREQAVDYLRSGEYRWNAGMFVVRPGVLLDLLAERDPEFASALRRLAAEPALLERTWPQLPRIALDHAVAEPSAAAGRVAVVPTDIDWHDVGDVRALHELLAQGQVRVLGDSARVLARDASGLVVPDGQRLVALLGVQDVVVVETPDALLVSTLDRAQEVRDLVEELRRTGRDELT